MVAVWYGQAECVLALGRVAGVELDTRDLKGESLEEAATMRAAEEMKNAAPALGLTARKV